ncbi:UNVERIFIED_CONTAM: hypothetical protein PYX00_005013 [Menopon gallinae]|uniref:Uncharacterized protein n=1 Tax=Menopon gallinae TaxID=328185 RepID=A0AAW2I6W3_9NEOP
MLFPELKMNLIFGLKYISVHWKFIVIVLVPLIFLPLPLQGSKELRCAYVVCIMAFYWMTEAIPLPVTSLLPVVLFPLLDVESTGKICVVYLKETNMMFIGGLIVAIAVEHCKLHVRIALKVLLMIGTSPKRLLLGFMVTTMFLSMWISNTATTAMMMPILIAVLDTLKSWQYEADGNRRPSLTLTAGVTKSRHDSGTFDQETRRKSSIRIDISSINRPTKDQICYFLGIAYAANIGGTGTISGSGTNLVFKGIFEGLFPNEGGVNFASWMAFTVPVMLINCFIAWIWLQILYMGLLRYRKGKMRSTPEQQKAVRELIKKKYKDLGQMTYHEVNVLILFLILVGLWFFRKPEFIPGWGQIYDDVNIEDATAAMLIVFLLFVLPANLDFLNFGRKVGKESPALLNWKIVHEKVPWGLVLLMGGGFAMAAASQKSGLSEMLGEQLIGLQELPPIAILTVVCLSTTFVTEVSSNTAIANIVLPVLAKLCAAIGVNPLYLMLPTTLCCSYAFMLPVATPPNAIVMAASNMRSLDMIKAGFGMNVMCVFSLIICFLTFGTEIYHLQVPLDARFNANLTIT